MTAAGSDRGEEHGRRADLAGFVESRWPEREREGIGPDEDAIVSAAAVSLVKLVWRNFPLEDMHRVATAALPKEFGLLEFEDHAWTGTAPGRQAGVPCRRQGTGASAH